MQALSGRNLRVLVFSICFAVFPIVGCGSRAEVESHFAQTSLITLVSEEGDCVDYVDASPTMQLSFAYQSWELKFQQDETGEGIVYRAPVGELTLANLEQLARRLDSLCESDADGGYPEVFAQALISGTLKLPAATIVHGPEVTFGQPKEVPVILSPPDSVTQRAVASAGRSTR